MLMYKLDEHGNPERVDDLPTWAVWLADPDTQRHLIICRNDIRDFRNGRGKFMFTLYTRFRGQAGPMDEPDRPLVWVTEGSDGSFYGATPTKEEAINNHQRQLRVLKSIYKMR